MATQDPSPSTTRGTSRKALIFVGALALAGLAYAIARVDILRARIATLNTAVRVQQDTLNQLTNAVQSLQQDRDTDRTQVTQLQQSVAALNQTLEGAHTNLIPVQRQWARIEALYLLRLAQHQLQLDSDIDAAAQSLGAAQLALAQDGELIALRAQLAQDLQQLRSLPLGDLERSQQRLQQVNDAVLSLPLRTDNMSMTAQQGSQAWATFKRSVGALITVRDRDADATLDADTLALRRAHAHALLSDAQLALRAHDQARYQTALKLAGDELKSVLDIRQPAVQAQLQALQQLASMNIAVAVPDLTAGIRQLAALAPANTPDTAP